MLRVDLSEIVRTIGMATEYVIDEAPYTDDDVEYVAPIRGKITVTNSGSLLLARGTVETVLALECSRCLIDVRQPIRGEIEEQYSLAEVESAAYHDVVPAIIQDEDNEIPAGLFDGLVMNLGVLIRQAAILATPLSPLCQEGCAGICASCGKNRNQGACKCVPDSTYRPFAALPELFKQEHTKD